MADVACGAGWAGFESPRRPGDASARIRHRRGHPRRRRPRPRRAAPGQGDRVSFRVRDIDGGAGHRASTTWSASSTRCTRLPHPVEVLRSLPRRCERAGAWVLVIDARSPTFRAPADEIDVSSTRRACCTACRPACAGRTPRPPGPSCGRPPSGRTRRRPASPTRSCCPCGSGFTDFTGSPERAFPSRT